MPIDMDNTVSSLLKQIDELKRHNTTLSIQLQQVAKDMASSSSSVSIAGIATLALRIDPDDKIIYANSPFCRHFGISKEDVLEKNVDVLKRFMDKGILETLARPTEPGSVERNATDEKGAVFDVRLTLIDGFLDAVLQDVSNEHRFKKYVERYVMADMASHSEEDLRSFKYPERRMMSVSFTDLRGFTAMSENMTPEEVRSTMNAYLEAVIGPILKNKATVDKIVGDEVMALFGAPKYYGDHALRAIKTVCDQMRNHEALQREFKSQGKVMPHCGIGVNTGDMVVGNMGSSMRQDYTVLGASVNLASRLCSAARPGEILVPQETLSAALAELPEDWSVVETRHEKTLNIEGIGIHGKTEGVFPLDDGLIGKVISIGPNVGADSEDFEYRFEYLYALKVKGFSDTLPVISVLWGDNEVALELGDQVVSSSGAERIFGRYRLLELIGRGGMGEVWKARDNFGNIVAIKMLLAGDGASDHQIRRFKREARIMAELQHRGICRIHEVGEIDKTTYIAMEYVQGVPLSAILNKGDTDAADLGDISILVSSIQSDRTLDMIGLGDDKNAMPGEEKAYRVLPVDQAVSIIHKVCDAIQYFHENKILHRDLKPGNIMIRPDGDPVVMDFGLAKAEQDHSTGLSLVGQVMGTIDYMSPEQAQSSTDVTAAADVYSVGAIFYQMVCGRRHFISSGNILTDATRLVDYLPPPPRERNDKISERLEEVILKALQPDVAERYASISDFREDLKAALAPAATAAPVQAASAAGSSAGSGTGGGGISKGTVIGIVLVLLAIIIGLLVHVCGLQEQIDEMNVPAAVESPAGEGG
jgi:class 3 adenylate cyclase/tRNA A-37 threonylcarbamoyl transferase component Bud32